MNPRPAAAFLGRAARVALAALGAATLLHAGPALGQSVQQSEEVPEDVQTFQDWRVQCESPEGAPQERCYMYQNLVMRESGQRVLLVGVVRDAQNAAAIFTAPLGVLLPPGVTIQVDDGDEMRVPFQQCGRQGCVARLRLGDELLSAMRAGLEAQVTIYRADQQPVSLPVSLKGFTAAYTALGERVSGGS